MHPRQEKSSPFCRIFYTVKGKSEAQRDWEALYNLISAKAKRETGPPSVKAHVLLPLILLLAFASAHSDIIHVNLHVITCKHMDNITQAKVNMKVIFKHLKAQSVFENAYLFPSSKFQPNKNVNLFLLWKPEKRRINKELLWGWIKQAIF